MRMPPSTSCSTVVSICKGCRRGYMPLPKEVDERVRKRLKELIEAGEEIVENVRYDPYDESSYAPGHVDYYHFITSSRNLIYVILGESRSQRLLGNIDDVENDYIAGYTFRKVLGLLKSLQEDYRSGLLEDWTRKVETNMANELINLAEQAQGRGLQQQYVRLLNAFTAGVILEDFLRRLCQRQTPPLETAEMDGEPKTLEPLITQLQKADVFNKAKADQLRSWAKIRNFAAHANFTELERSDVDQMVLGVKAFLGELQ